MEIPYFVLNERINETFLEEDNRTEGNLIYVKKGVINLTVAVVSSNRNFIVSVEETDTLGFLCRKIGEEMESFDQFKGVMGLRARNLRLRGSMEIITNLKDRVEMHFKDGDEVLCDLQSEDLWLKCEVQFHSTFMREWNSNFELRVKQDSLIVDLKRMVQKVAINFWNTGISNSTLYKKQITVMKDLAVIKREGVRDSLLSIGLSLDEISQLEKIKDHFTFESTLLIVCKFTTLEDEFNQQNPNFQRLHNRMLGFFGVGIPKKTQKPREDDSEYFLFQESSSQYRGTQRILSGVRNDRSEEITEQLKKSEKKGGPSFRGSHGPLYRETSHSIASSNSNNPNNILYENVVMPHMQSTFDNQPVYMIEGENIKEEDEEISSSNTFSSKSVVMPINPRLSHAEQLYLGQDPGYFPQSYTANEAALSRDLTSKKFSTKRTQSLQRKTEHTFQNTAGGRGEGESSQRIVRLKQDQEKMIRLVKLPSFLLNSKELRSIRVIVRNKKLHIGDEVSKSSLYEHTNQAQDEQTTVRPNDMRKKCAILWFVVLMFSVVVLIAIIFEIKQ